MAPRRKLTLPRVGGLLVGFAGVVTLMSRGLSSEALESNVAGQLAVLAGSTSYAVAATFSRRYLRDRPPLAQSTAVVFVADSLLWLATPIAERPFHLPSAPITWFALAWLGLLGVCLAYQLYFYLLNQWGATRTSLVTYVLPAVGLVLGIVFLREAADWRLIAGSILVVAGIAVVNPPLTASTPAAAGAAE